MISENLKNCTDEEIINIINNIMTQEEKVTTTELKKLLAEASSRKLEKKYINVIADKIKSEIEKKDEPSSPKRKTSNVKESKEKVKKPSFDDLYNKEETDEEDDEDEKYPILSFLISLYKIFAWIFLVGSIGTVVVTAGFLYKFSVFQICLIMFGSLIAGIILLIFFYSCSEKLQWKIDVEKHLRKIK